MPGTWRAVSLRRDRRPVRQQRSTGWCRTMTPTTSGRPHYPLSSRSGRWSSISPVSGCTVPRWWRCSPKPSRSRVGGPQPASFWSDHRIGSRQHFCDRCRTRRARGRRLHIRTSPPPFQTGRSDATAPRALRTFCSATCPLLRRAGRVCMEHRAIRVRRRRSTRIRPRDPCSRAGGLRGHPHGVPRPVQLYLALRDFNPRVPVRARSSSDRPRMTDLLTSRAAETGVIPRSDGGVLWALLPA